MFNFNFFFLDFMDVVSGDVEATDKQLQIEQLAKARISFREKIQVNEKIK